MKPDKEQDPYHVPQHDLEWQEDNQHKHHYQHLEKRDPEKGYSTDPGQGDPGVSYPLRDEDTDRITQDPVADAENLKESYEMAHNEGETQEQEKTVQEPIDQSETVQSDKSETDEETKGH